MAPISREQMNEPPKDFIEHIPGERREPKWLWKAAFVFVALFWLLQWSDGFEWDNIALGVITGLFIGLWGMEMTGGEVPASWRKATRRR